MSLDHIEYDPFSGPEIVKLVPTVEPQLEIWLACVIGNEDANRAYNESVSLLLTGRFDQTAFGQALEDVTEMHESFRSSFSADGTKMCIYKELPTDLQYEDLSDLNSTLQKEYIRQFSKRNAETAFDLVNGPLFRVALFKLGPEEHYLTLTAHHIICDGWSLGIWMQDLSKSYNARKRSRQPDMGDIVPFSKYAEDQWAYAATSEYQKTVQYWVDQYREQVPVLDLPTDYPRPSIRTYKSHRDDFELDQDLVASLKKMGAASGCSFVTTLLVAFEVYMHRLTGQEDIVLGLPTAGQSATGNYRLIGHCVNLLPLKSHLEDSTPFIEYLKKRKRELLDDYDHQQLTFGSLLKKLKLNRDPSRVPLVPVVFNMDMGLDDGVTFDGLVHKLIYNPREYESFEISVNATASAQSFTLEWSYNTQLFKPDTIGEMMGRFETLLRELVADPSRKVGSLRIISQREEDLLIHGFNATGMAYPKDLTVVGLFERQAAQTPEAVALVWEGGECTYRELDARSNRLAHYLLSRGVRAEMVVPVCIERSPEMIVSILGILKAGAAYVPVDPDFPSERMGYILEDVGARAVVSSSGCRGMLPVKADREVIDLDERREEIRREPSTSPRSEIALHHLAYIIFTSGSTGRPKGVMIEHGNLLNYLLNSKTRYLDETRSSSGTFLHLAFTFDASITCLLMPLIRGKSIVISPAKAWDIFQSDIFRKHAPYDFIKLTPGHMRLLELAMPGLGGIKPAQKLVIGGEALQMSHIQYWAENGLEIEMINEYGPTETTIGCTTYAFSPQDDMSLFRSGISIGRPIDNTTIYIIDSSGGLCPIGIRGEIYIGGDQVARGYLNRPELTEEKFIANPYGEGRIYRTGDYGRWHSDGTIEYLGRMDDQVKIRGYRIELQEIENVLQESPGVSQSVVLVKDSPELGPHLVGYVVPEGKMDHEEVLSFLKSRLPGYMIPPRWVELRELPLTPNGKVNRKALPDPQLVEMPGRENIPMESKLGYWKLKLEGATPLNLPTDYERPSVQSTKGGMRGFSIDEKLTEALRELSRSQGTTLYMTLLAAFKMMMYRYSGQEDIVVGSLVDGQIQEETEELIGFFVNTLALRSQVKGEMDFVELLQEVKETTLGGYEHQEVPFERVVETVVKEWDMSRNPLIQVMFILQNITELPALGSEDMEMGEKSYVTNSAKFDLTFYVTEKDEGLRINIEYCSDLFNAETIDRMGDHYRELLREIVADPSRRVGDMRMLTQREREQLINEFNATGVEYPKELTVVDLFERHAALTPESVALIWEGVEWSYRELDARSSRLAHYLRSRGVRPETMVPLCIERCADMVVGILGILKAGGAYVPVDPDFPGDRIAYMLEDVGTRIVVSSRGSRGKLPVKAEVIELDGNWEEISEEPATSPRLEIAPHSLAYIIYTSGSTGRPKGVMIEHRNLLNVLLGLSDAWGFGVKSRMLSVASFSFDMFCTDMQLPLCLGGTLILMGRDQARDGHRLMEAISKWRPTHMEATPSSWQMLLDGQWENAEGVKVLMGGERVKEQLKEEMTRRGEVWNGYGPTETTIYTTLCRLQSGERVRIGRPVSNVQVYILEKEGQPSPVGVPGEICIAGAGVSRGYLNRPELTKEKFSANPFGEGRIYRTGDLGRWHTDGTIEYIGRMDDQVKIRGYRIELGEIENVLQESPGVRQSLVMVRESPELGPHLVGYVVPAGEFQRESILNYVKRKLPVYMIPRVLVEIESIPITSNGKFDKKLLPDPSVIKEFGNKKTEIVYTENQQLVAEVMADALGLKHIHLSDDFFDLGGHSLIAVNVMKRLQERTGKRLPITALFEAPTVEKLSAMLDMDKKMAKLTSLVAIKRSGTKPPLYIIHGSGLTVLIFNGLAKGMDPDQPVYGIQARGLNGEDPFDKMEDIAAFYISEILAHNPEGPYCLGGYSFGGKVAFEMAKQLKAMGKEIKMLAILDTYADNPPYENSIFKRMNIKFKNQFPKMRFIWNSFMKNPRETLQYQGGLFKTRIRNLLESLGWIERKKEEEEYFSEYARDINEKHHYAYRHYRITPYNGAIDLFRVKKRLYFVEDPEYLGWKPYAMQGVRVHEIAGDHKTFLMPPNDQEMALAVKNALKDLERSEEGRGTLEFQRAGLRRV